MQLTATLTALLAGTFVAARGPKPTAVLRQRGVRIDFSAADPFTTAEVLDAIGGVTLANETVVVQRYGDANEPLNDALARAARSSWKCRLTAGRYPMTRGRSRR